MAAETIARSAEPLSYDRRISLAEEALVAAAPLPDWFDFYDASRLDGFAGYCALAAGDKEQAKRRLSFSLESLSQTARKQRTVLLADLATAELEDPERSISHLHEALDLLTIEWYATGHRRIGTVIRALLDVPAKHAIEERHSLAASAGRW